MRTDHVFRLLCLCPHPCISCPAPVSRFASNAVPTSYLLFAFAGSAKLVNSKPYPPSFFALTSPESWYLQLIPCGRPFETSQALLEVVTLSTHAGPVTLRLLQRNCIPSSPNPVQDPKVFYRDRLGHVPGYARRGRKPNSRP